MRPLYYSNIIRKAALALSFFAYQATNAQNLVVDPSFENVNVASLQCSWYTTAAQFASAMNVWTCPTGGSTDVFHTSLATSCYCSPFSTNASSPGTQAPRTGNTYCNIVTYGSGGCTPYREYIQGRLSSALVVGTQYNVSMWVTLADKMSVGTNNIGIKFSANPYSSASMCVYATTPELNYTGPIILNKTNWVQISFTYTPTVAGLDNFIIGNFFSDAATSTAAASGVTSGTTIRYFVEDVVIAPVVLLPIELQSFTAKCVNSEVSIDWATDSEKENDYFTIERSTNGVDFEALDDVQAGGTTTTITTYNWSDKNPINGTSYYRLKQTNFDGSWMHSEIIAVNCEIENDPISIFPNPFNEAFTLSLDAAGNKPVNLTILNCTGQVVHSQVIENQAGNIELSVGEKLDAGIYFIKVNAGDLQYVRKLVKI